MKLPYRIKLSPYYLLSVLVLLVTITTAPAQNRTAPRQPKLEGVIVDRDLAYGPAVNGRNLLDLYRPEDAEGPLPLIIWIHGGGWQSGSKEECLPVRLGFVQKGYAIASINYRLSGDAIFPAQIEDCKSAIRWLRAHADEFGIDPDRFGAWGSSAGGHLAALVGTSGEVADFDVGENLEYSSKVQAVCDFYGPIDLTAMVKTPGYERHARADSAESKLLGAPVLEVPDRAREANPISYITKDSPPFLIMHGDRDPVVPFQQSLMLGRSLEKAGATALFRKVPDSGHGGPGFQTPQTQAMVATFFAKHLAN